MLMRYLPTVIRHSSADDVAVIVADNASTDDSLQILQTHFPDVRTIVLDRNYGFADGYNRALRNVEAQYYMLLNSDVEIRQPHWLDPMLEYMDTHPTVAACQPKLLQMDGNTFEYAGAAGGYIDRWGYPYCRGRVMDTVETDHGQYDNPCMDIHWATGAAMLVRSDAYWQAGGLDARFFCHMEEIDLCWRLRIMGWHIACVPASTAHHLGGATLAQGNPRKTLLNFRNNLLMLYKNLPANSLHLVMTTRHLLDAVAAIRFLLTGDAANARAVIKALKQYLDMRRHYVDERHRIQELRKLSPQDDLRPLSILWQYYVRKRHTYDAMIEK